MTHNELTPIVSGDAASSAAARLARVKAEAAQRQAARNLLDLDEGEVLTEAARGMVARRAARHDLVGAMLWEAIAEGNVTSDGAGTPPAHPVPPNPLRDDQREGSTGQTGCPAVRRAGRD